jgi:HSP20 family protein
MAAQGTATKPAREQSLTIQTAGLTTRMKHMFDSIARRAYEIFEAGGRTMGRDLDHWSQAEAELLHLAHIEITESENQFTVRVEVPGFNARDLEVSVEPRHVTIAGKREHKEERKTRETVYQEACSDQIYRAFDLPGEIDTSRASATLQNGVLELGLPKAAQPKKTTAA